MAFGPIKMSKQQIMGRGVNQPRLTLIITGRRKSFLYTSILLSCTFLLAFPCLGVWFLYLALTLMVRARQTSGVTNTFYN